MSDSLIPRLRIAGSTSSEMYVQRHVFHASTMERGNQSATHMASWDSTTCPAWPRSHRRATASTRSSNVIPGTPKWSKPRKEPLRRQRQVVVRVDGAPAVADDDAGEVDALLGEDPLLFEAPRLRRSRRVGADRHPGGAVGARHARSTCSTPGVRPARSVAHLRMPARTRFTDALADLPDEVVDHRLLAAEHRAVPGSRSTSGPRCRCRPPRRRPC